MGTDASVAGRSRRCASSTATVRTQPLHWCRQSGRRAAFRRSGHRAYNAQWPALPYVLRERMSGAQLLPRLLLSQAQGRTIMRRSRCDRRTIGRRMPYRQHFARAAFSEPGPRFLKCRLQGRAKRRPGALGGRRCALFDAHEGLSPNPERTLLVTDFCEDPHLQRIILSFVIDLSRKHTATTVSFSSPLSI